VTYYGGLIKDIRSNEYTLDLSVYKDLSSVIRYGLHELANDIQKIVRYSEKTSKDFSKLTDSISHGLYLRNPIILCSLLQSDPQAWKWQIIGILLELKYVWSSTYGTDHDKLLNPFLNNLRIRLGQIGE
jgi:NDP-sugar pyrophosphorylase family protein